jgi:hypothetical protein
MVTKWKRNRKDQKWNGNGIKIECDCEWNGNGFKNIIMEWK